VSTVTQDRPLGYEANGINVISEDERKGTPRDLFWPWFAANISVLGLAYGAYVLGFGISFWQACVAGLIGIVVSFLLVGFIAVAGKRGSAPTLVLSRAAFGVQGNKLPALVSWILNVGWEIVLTVLATLATAWIIALSRSSLIRGSSSRSVSVAMVRRSARSSPNEKNEPPSRSPPTCPSANGAACSPTLASSPPSSTA